jgi:hypothetical protein
MLNSNNYNNEVIDAAIARSFILLSVWIMFFYLYVKNKSVELNSFSIVLIIFLIMAYLGIEYFLVVMKIKKQ